MKVSPEHYATMRDAMAAVAKAIPELPIWGVWHDAEFSLFYDDSHPWFQDGTRTRKVPHNPAFAASFKTASYKDEHIETALRRIGKELKLI